jgi:hypothetical protein
MLRGGSRSAGFGSGPLPHPATQQAIVMGGREGVRAGTARSEAFDAERIDA